MKIWIRNLLSLQQADLDFERAPIWLIGARNEAGKSSVIDGVRMALTGDHRLRGLTQKTQLKMAITRGAKSAQVRMQDGDRDVTIRLPEGEVETRGPFQPMDPIELGAASLFEMKDKDRAQWLGESYAKNPSRQDLVEWFQRHAPGLFREKDIDSVWAQVTNKGWQGAESAAANMLSTERYRWEQAAQERWGERKIESWRPDDWTPELEKLSAEQLGEQLKEAEAAEHEAVRGAGYSQAERDALQAKADRLEDFTSLLKDAQREHDNVQAELDRVVEGLGRLPSAEGPVVYHCPHCEGRLRVELRPGSRFEIQRAGDDESLSEAEVKKRNEALAEARAQADQIRERLQARQADLARATNDYHEARSAKEKIKQTKNQSADQQKAIDKAKRRTEIARKRKAMRAAVNVAEKHATRSKRWLWVTRALKPDGVRQAVLERALGAINEAIEGLCGEIGLPGAFKVTSTGGVIWHDGSPYGMLSHSGRIRANLIFAMAVQIAGGSRRRFVVVDELEAMNRDDRARLLAMLPGNNFRAVLCLVAADRSTYPDLAQPAFGIGASGWIENGILEEIGQ